MKPIVPILFAAASMAVAAANAQDTGKSAAKPAAPAEQESGANIPGLGEVMTLQQLRHIKLWFAGHNANWPLADYEVGELGEGFEDVGKLIGADFVDKQVGAAMKALQKAIDDKNRPDFEAAFDKLSAGCNSCHRALDHAFIAIQRPTLLPYSNQNFAPQK